LQFQPLFRNGHVKVDDVRHTNLGLHDVGGSPVERIDPKMPLDPFAEQFHLPSLLADVGDRLRGDGEETGQKHQASEAQVSFGADHGRRPEVDEPHRGDRSRGIHDPSCRPFLAVV